MKKPEDLIWVGAAFGGGLNNKDLCGFLTSGEMAIGIFSGDLKRERKAAKEICGQKPREFWQWWISTAPLHCAEIREGRTDYKVCARLGKLAAARLEDLIKPAYGGCASDLAALDRDDEQGHRLLALAA